MSTIYLRYEPTDDHEILRLIAEMPHIARLNRKRDVQAYHDEAATTRACRWPWWRSHPTRAWKRLNLNYSTATIVWLPDLESRA